MEAPLGVRRGGGEEESRGAAGGQDAFPDGMSELLRVLDLPNPVQQGSESRRIRTREKLTFSTPFGSPMLGFN